MKWINNHQLLVQSTDGKTWVINSDNLELADRIEVDLIKIMETSSSTQND